MISTWPENIQDLECEECGDIVSFEWWLDGKCYQCSVNAELGED